MASRRQRILEAIRRRLQAIQIDAGFDTGLGQVVYLGERPELGDADPDGAIAMVVGDENPAPPGQTLKTYLQLPIEIQVIAKANLDEPWVAIEAGIGDVKRAMELPDRTLGGLANTMERGGVRTLPREPGSTAVGAGVGYVVTFAETWGAP